MVLNKDTRGHCSRPRGGVGGRVTTGLGVQLSHLGPAMSMWWEGSRAFGSGIPDGIFSCGLQGHMRGRLGLAPYRSRCRSVLRVPCPSPFLQPCLLPPPDLPASALRSAASSLFLEWVWGGTVAQTLKEGGSRPGLREGLGSRMERDWVGLRTCTKAAAWCGQGGPGEGGG